MAGAGRYADDGLEVNRANEGLQHHKPKEGAGLHYYDSQPNGDGEYKEVRRNAIPFGLSALVFGLLVALVTALIVGAAVGGGVGGALSGSDCSRTTTTAQAHTVTVTTTATLSAGQTAPTTDLKNYAVALPANVDTLSWNCPSISSYTTSGLDPNEAFDITCFVDYSNGEDAVGGGIVADIIGIVAYSAGDCMEACANFNMFQTTWANSTKCAGVTWSTILSGVYSKYGANCWLKNGTTGSPSNDNNELSAALVS